MYKDKYVRIFKVLMVTLIIVLIAIMIIQLILGTGSVRKHDSNNACYHSSTNNGGDNKELRVRVV